MPVADLGTRITPLQVGFQPDFQSRLFKFAQEIPASLRSNATGLSSPWTFVRPELWLADKLAHPVAASKGRACQLCSRSFEAAKIFQALTSWQVQQLRQAT